MLMNATTELAAAEDTVLDRFRRHLPDRAERDLYVFVDDKGNDAARLTYRAFADATDRLAAHLTTALGLRRGDRVLLVYPPSPDFVIAFVGCLAAGIVPVPLAPPNPFQLTRDLRAFESIAASSGSVAALTNGAYLRAKRLAAAKDLFVRRQGAWSTLPWYRSDRLDSGSPAPPAHVPRPDETAFLQYTSGSTSSPKGVMISHANILHQVAINAADLGLTDTSKAVLWVPHFHDFCLVSGILSALYGNAVLYLMSPITFLRRPHLWFDVMSRVRATHTAAPDFAYRLAVRKTTAEQRRRWDLSALEVAMSAAEPIRPSTVDAFVEDFAVAGFDRRAFCPAYGLAEHTVGVSVAGRRRLQVDRSLLEVERRVVAVDDGAADALTLFGCGRPSAGVDVRIVDPETARELEAGRIGEIWVDSPSKALGYFGLEELSRRAFRARLAEPDGDHAEDGYLRTGDLGFLHDGEVFVTGRLKDLIILRGRNLYPQDLEESVFSSHPLIRPGRAAAFSVPAARRIDPASQEREQIVVLTEAHSKRVAEPQLDDISRAVRARVQREHGISCDAILIAPPGEILKTTSGKVRRQACRAAYLNGTLDGRLLRVDVKPKPRAAP